VVEDSVLFVLLLPFLLCFFTLVEVVWLVEVSPVWVFWAFLAAGAATRKEPATSIRRADFIAFFILVSPSTVAELLDRAQGGIGSLLVSSCFHPSLPVLVFRRSQSHFRAFPALALSLPMVEVDPVFSG